MSTKGGASTATSADSHSPRPAHSPASTSLPAIFHKMRLSRAGKLYFAIAVSSAFFIVEIVIGFRQRSLALVADAFHVASDLIGFLVALVAVQLANKKQGLSPAYSYGLQRGPVLGAFFNGCFLSGLGFSIVLSSIERLITPESIEEPVLVLIVGSVGLALNVLSAAVVHEHGDGGDGHSHSHSHNKTATVANLAENSKAEADDSVHVQDEETLRASAVLSLSARGDEHALHIHTLRPPRNKHGMDLNILGVMIHLLGDAINNLAVMIAAVIVWKTGFNRADSIASLFVGFSIIATAIPLMKSSGRLLLEAAPREIDLRDVKDDLTSLEGVVDIHEMHVFSLTQRKHIASLHVRVAPNTTMAQFVSTARSIRECLHAWGLHGGVTVQPELAETGTEAIGNIESSGNALAVEGADAGSHAMTPRPSQQGGNGHSSGVYRKTSQAIEVNKRNCQVACVDDCDAQPCCD